MPNNSIFLILNVKKILIINLSWISDEWISLGFNKKFGKISLCQVLGFSQLHATANAIFSSLLSKIITEKT